MLRIVGLSLLLLGIAAPSFAGLCNTECAFMQTPQSSGSFFDEGLPPCCATVQNGAPASQSVQPKAKFRNVIPLQTQTLPRTASAQDSYHDYLPVSSSSLSTVRLSPSMLRI